MTAPEGIEEVSFLSILACITSLLTTAFPTNNIAA
jgi:hypothetical protein